MAQIKDDLLERKIATAMLIMFMRNTDDKSERALMLQRYVQHYGPVPNDYREKVVEAMEGSHETD